MTQEDGPSVTDLTALRFGQTRTENPEQAFEGALRNLTHHIMAYERFQTGEPLGSLPNGPVQFPHNMNGEAVRQKMLTAKQMLQNAYKNLPKEVFNARRERFNQAMRQYQKHFGSEDTSELSGTDPRFG